MHEKVKEAWTPPPAGVLHCDGKLMATLDGGGKEERLPVLISGDGGTKLLGVPQLPPAEPLQVGEHIAAAAVGLVKEWAAEDSIVGMCFDTTNVNSGIFTTVSQKNCLLLKCLTV